MNFLTNLFYTILMLSVLVFFTFFASIIPLLNGDIIYVPFIVVTSLSLFLWFVFHTFGLLQKRKAKKGLVLTVAFLFVCAGGYLANHLYKQNMETVSAEVDLFQYLPNSEGAKVATLEDVASLQLPKENLLRLDGATALYPLYSAFVQATYPKKEYHFADPTVRASKTPEAYNNLIEGTADIIFVAEPSEAKLKYAEKMGVTLNMTPIGREAFVFFVHAKNSVEGLSSEQIRDIYSGKVTNWKEVGGKNDSLRPFQRPTESGSQTAMHSFMGRVPLMEAPTENVVSGMGGVISEVSEYKNYRNAIGYTFRFFSTEMVKNDNIRLLEVDGVYPDKESIRSGTYPITSEFYAITAGTTNPHAQAFIDWILSDEGQDLVEKTGYVPINN